MAKLKLRGKDLRAIGYPEGPVISIAMNIMEKQFKFEKEDKVMNLLKEILASPVEYANDAVLGLIAQQLLPKAQPEGMEISLNKSGVAFNIFGGEKVEQTAINQMYQAARLPIAVAGALMPDAHMGYGLPIGGVLATENAVIPYGVGVDIGCRMCLSVFDIDPKELIQKEQYFTRELKATTLFGGGRQFDQSTEHEVLDREEFTQLPLLKGLQGRAARQLGSSGSGNHFVEFGIVEIDETDPVLGLAPGRYLGLLSHSGSRALGASIANHYTRIAKQRRRLPGEANNLAWLTLDEEEGIHEGRELIVHRKGATPAGKNVLGIIPGSMTAPGYIVKGRGEQAAVSSAAHGAGRKMSRTAAMNSISHELMQATLESHGVKLLGGGLDEAPQAYKDIEAVMHSQRQLVDVLGRFTPKIVRMDG